MTPKQELKIHFPPELQGGAYANNMFVTHTREEFIMDFILTTPQTGTVTSRVITSPGHMKRIIAALQENLQKYEQAFGELKPAEAPQGTDQFSGAYL